MSKQPSMSQIVSMMQNVPEKGISKGPVVPPKGARVMNEENSYQNASMAWAKMTGQKTKEELHEENTNKLMGAALVMKELLEDVDAVNVNDKIDGIKNILIKLNA